MEKINIVNHSELLMHLLELKKYREVQEEEIKEIFGGIVTTFASDTFLKKPAVQNQPVELAKSVINMALDVIIDITLKKHRSVKGYLSAVIAERFALILVDNNITNILSGISFLFKRRITTDENNK